MGHFKEIEIGFMNILFRIGSKKGVEERGSKTNFWCKELQKRNRSNIGWNRSKFYQYIYIYDVYIYIVIHIYVYMYIYVYIYNVYNNKIKSREVQNDKQQYNNNLENKEWYYRTYGKI